MTLKFPDYNLEVEAKVMMDVLHLDTPALPSDKNKELYLSAKENVASLLCIIPLILIKSIPR